ncbi:MAG: hypothetical protein BEN18_02170 [Epulopiscium sp. Nuni2H_MBin001]|nr:MAG: hypothetical protein BEN18_02170 [Epulopiscium sp. Nuni2H_MBin001]
MGIKKNLKKFLPSSSNTFMNRTAELENQLKGQKKLMQSQQQQTQALLLQLLNGMAKEQAQSLARHKEYKTTIERKLMDLKEDCLDTSVQETALAKILDIQQITQQELSIIEGKMSKLETETELIGIDLAQVTEQVHHQTDSIAQQHKSNCEHQQQGLQTLFNNLAAKQKEEWLEQKQEFQKQIDSLVKQQESFFVKTQENFKMEIEQLALAEQEIYKEKMLQEIRDLNFEQCIFSIIIPVYNAAPYLKECLDTIFKQTLHSSGYEVICVDDGSTDDSAIILKEYEEKYTNLKVINQENQYLGAARNNGMSLATGVYILFIDADDFIEYNMLEQAYLRIQQTHAEIIIVGANIYDEVHHKFTPAPWLLRPSYLPDKLVFSTNDISEYIFHICTASVWNKFIKRELIEVNNIQFTQLRTVEDVPFTYSLMAIATTITVITQDLYHLRRGQSTNISANNDLIDGAFFEGYQLLQEQLQNLKVYDKVQKSFINRVLSGCIYEISRIQNQKQREAIEKLFIEEYCYNFKIHNKDRTYFYEEYTKIYNEYLQLVDKYRNK